MKKRLRFKKWDFVTPKETCKCGEENCLIKGKIYQVERVSRLNWLNICVSGYEEEFNCKLFNPVYTFSDLERDCKC